ncbi:MAG: antibiotic biosynthesis monooxygenase family protein [Acidobacteriota bacterium]
MFVAMSTFTVANGMAEEVKRAFIDRPHLVDSTPSFARLEVMSPLDDPEEIRLLTYWTDERSFKEWYGSPKFRESHRSIPKGLKLVFKRTRTRSFELVCS